jgi:hypothetical protein
MTDKLDDGNHAADALVRSIYREVAGERTPAGLDEAVLANARHATAASRPRRRTWMPPLALAASIGLCIALVLQLTGVPAPGARQQVPPAQSPAAVHEAAVESRAQKMGDAYREKSATAPGVTSVNSAAEISGLARSTAPSAQETAGANDMRDYSDNCGAAERAGPLPWLECIESLEAGGQTSLAAAERKRLQQSHPGFTPARN